jgi:LmbE family N-acetylglucosaminyl deacetylase
MKPTPIYPPDTLPVLAFGAHPDDIEFGCGGVIVQETLAGRAAHLVVCSRGEAATHGQPEQRTTEAERAAALLGATIDFVELDEDSHLEVRAPHAIALAGVLRQVRPGIVLAPSIVENQHPDHWRLGRLVCDAARLACFGGLQELATSPPHRISHLLFYAITRKAEPDDISPVLIDISRPEIVAAWVATMEAHASQTSARNYVEVQLTRPRLKGLGATMEYATALFPADPLVFASLSGLGRRARGP